jgi:asparagine synthase (glutamine-hydrolysing)
LNPACETRFNSDGEYVEAFRSIFDEAVRTRLRTTHKVGSLLSGGLDSSSISAVAGRLLAKSNRGSLATFSGVFDAVPRTNERHFIEAAVMKGGFEPSYLAVDRCDPFFVPPEVERTQAEAQIAPNMFLTWGMYDMARKSQVRVLLDGFDGDTTISHGIGYLSELARTNHWLKLTKLVPAVVPHSEQSAAGIWWEYIWRDGLLPKIPARAVQACQGAARRLRSWRPAGRPGSVCACMLDPAFVERVGLREYRSSLRTISQRPPQTEKEFHYRKLMWAVIPFALELMNHGAASFGIEVRFPFWDRRLVEFCLGLPPDLKIRDGYTRWILRQAMEDDLPRKIQWRPGKSNLAFAFRHCLFNHGRPVLNHALETAKQRLRPYLCANHFEFTKRRIDDNANDMEIMYLWRVAKVALWMERMGIQS